MQICPSPPGIKMKTAEGFARPDFLIAMPAQDILGRHGITVVGARIDAGGQLVTGELVRDEISNGVIRMPHGDVP